MATEMDFIVHYLCPYAQRALYVYAYKGIQSQITEVSLVNKSEYFLSVNPLGKVPSLKVTKEGKSFNLYESLVVCDYFDSFEGPSLYPRNADNSVNQEEKALISMAIATEVDKFPGLMFKAMMAPGEESLNELRAKLTEFSTKFLADGNYFMHSILGRNELTMADLVLLPFIERLYAYKDDIAAPFIEGLDLSNLWAWYDKFSGQEWFERMKVGEPRLKNFMKLRASGERTGLDLPLSIYD